MPARTAQAAACSWNGSTSTDWATGSNWTGCTGGGIPANADTVTIPSAPANQPIITAAVTSAGITIDSGASLTINTGGSLSLTGNFTNNGTFTANAGTVTLATAAGQTVTVSGTGSFTYNNLTIGIGSATVNINSDMTIKGNLTRGGGTYNPGVMTTTFDGGGTSQLLGTSAQWFHHLVIAAGTTVTTDGANTNIHGDFTNNGTFTQGTTRLTTFNTNAATSNLYGTGATTFGGISIPSGKTVNAGSHSFTIAASATRVPWTNSGGTFNGGTATVTFNYSSTASWTGSGTPVNNFNNITINAGRTVSVGAQNMNVAGDWVNNGTFTTTTGRVTFNGGKHQKISGDSATTFYNLTVLSPSSGVTDLTFATLPVVSNTFTVDKTNNSIVLRQARLVPSGTVSFFQFAGYRGVDVTPTGGDLGTVTVVMTLRRSTDYCTSTGAGSPAYAMRCYDITTTQGAGAGLVIS